MPPSQGLPGLHDQEQKVDFQGNLPEINDGGMGLLHGLGVDMGGVDSRACGPPSSACGVVGHSCLVVGTTIGLGKAAAATASTMVGRPSRGQNVHGGQVATTLVAGATAAAATKAS